MRWLRWLLILGIVGGAAYATPKVRAYWQERNRPKFRTLAVKRGSIRYEVRATGTIQPVLKVTIGAFVSGPIVELRARFNQRVKKGELLARIDPRLYEAAVNQNEANFATAKAEVERVRANLQQARNDERRARRIREINPDYLSDSEMDQYRFARQALEAQLIVAQQSAAQAEAALENARANLNYANIYAPTDGIIIDQKVDEGQTVVAQFQTPELFVIAPDMDQRMWVRADVLEADIGLVTQAMNKKAPVDFTVDAYPDELFHGTIREIRQNPTTDQNVVTYPVIVETSNQEMKLMPGMTANLSFEIDRRDNVLLIPGAAIRFLPDKKYVREEDQSILEGTEEEDSLTGSRSAADRVQSARRRKQRHVWIAEGDKLRAVPVEFGIDDGRYYELVKGDLTEGQELVVEVQKD